jgi:hypothetical protein
MNIFRNEFKPGDLVVWRDAEWAATASAEERYGAGPFVIDRVVPVTRYFSSVGHIQHVQIVIAGQRESFSGALFRHLEDKPE